MTIYAAISWRGMEYWPVALCVLGLIVAALAFLYPPQIRRIGAHGRWALPVLRIAALAALTISILRPVLIRARSVQEQGTIVVLVDRSMSMGVLDRSLARPEDRRAVIGQLVALADALGRLPEGARSHTITGLYDIQRLEALADEIARAWREMDFARLSGRTPDEVRARFDRLTSEFIQTARNAEASVKAAAPKAALDHLARLARRPRGDPAKWVDGLRSAVASAAVDAQRSQDNLDEDLYASNPQVRKACDQLAALSRLDLSLRLLAEGKSSLLARLDQQTPLAAVTVADTVAPLPLPPNSLFTPPLKVDAAGPSTDLIGGIADSLRRLAGQSIQAVVLFSDGRQVGAAHRTLPSGLLPAGVPVFCVYAAAPSMRDLAIDHIEIPQAVFVNEPLPVRVSVRTVGNIDLANLRGNASISVRDGPPTTRPLRLKDRRIQMPMVQLPEAGLQHLVVRLAVQQGEADAENNRAERWVKVMAQKLRVMLIGGSSTWDYRFIRNALAATGWVQLHDAIVSRTSPLNMSREDILQQDLVILSDVSRDVLSGEQWLAIRDLVRARGASVIIVPGAGFAQQQFAGHVLADFLPYSITGPKPVWRTWLGQNPSYRLVPNPAIPNLPLLDDTEEGESRWDDLPGLYHYLELPELKKEARPLLLEQESNAPVLTEEHVGSGRAFFFGINESWRWRQTGAGDHDRFWQQLVRLAADEPYTLVQGSVFFDANPMAADPATPIQVRARLLPRTAELPRWLDVLLMRDGAILQTVTLNPVGEAGAGRYRGTVGPLPSGDYELKLIGPSDEGESVVLVLPLKIQSNPQEELADVSGDRPFLQNLAEATGGKCLNLEQVPTLPALLEDARKRHPQTLELRLWDSGYLFIFVLSCLSAEWALRKRFGLA